VSLVSSLVLTFTLHDANAIAAMKYKLYFFILF
jgi:hypothetical protein